MSTQKKTITKCKIAIAKQTKGPIYGMSPKRKFAKPSIRGAMLPRGNRKNKPKAPGGPHRRWGPGATALTHREWGPIGTIITL